MTHLSQMSLCGRHRTTSPGLNQVSPASTIVRIRHCSDPYNSCLVQSIKQYDYRVTKSSRIVLIGTVIGPIAICSTINSLSFSTTFIDLRLVASKVHFTSKQLARMR